MPYKSIAQARKFHALLKQGKINKKVVAEYDKESKGMKLPMRVKKQMMDCPTCKGKGKVKKGSY